MYEYLPELRVLREFCLEVYQLFDTEQVARLARRRRTLLLKKAQYQQQPELGEAMGRLAVAAGLGPRLRRGAAAAGGQLPGGVAARPGLRPVQIVVVRDPSGRMGDIYLFSTDLKASPAWVITQFAWRWSIEVLFRSSKQVLQIEAPGQWRKESVEKLAPWVWSMQGVIVVWYLTAGHTLPEAEQMRRRMGPWDSEWSLRHTTQVLQRATLHASINPASATEPQPRQMVQTLENWALLAA